MIRFGDAKQCVCFLATRKEPVIALAVAPRSLHVRETSFAITSTYTVTNPFYGIGSVTKSRRFCYATPRTERAEQPANERAQPRDVKKVY